MHTLTIGTTLHNGTYRIERVLGQGGYGITYLATDMHLQRLVAIKEFFPKELCDRSGETTLISVPTGNTGNLVARLRERFLSEARNIARLDHPNIIRIHAAFEENDTAYYVMEYIEGMSLQAMVKRDGPLPENRAMEYISKVGDALEYVHARSINHLDVKPANIMVREKDETPILIDFGLAKRYDTEGNETSTTIGGVSHGYAPMEQYDEGGLKGFSPRTDLYSLAATLYYLLSGERPPQALTLIEEKLTFPASVPARITGPIAKAMSPSRSNRQASVREFTSQLPRKKPAEASTTSGTGKKWLIAVVAAAVVAIAAGFLLRPSHSGAADATEPVVAQTDTEATKDEPLDATPDAIPSGEIEPEDAPDPVPEPEAAPDPEPEPTKTLKDRAPEEPKEKTPAAVATTGTLQLGYGTWTGGVKNGKPHGTGILTFSSTHKVDRSSSCEANPGDYFKATYENGQLVNGKLYDSAGNLLKTIIP